MPKKMRDALKRQDYAFLGLEVIVVIFSILVAFQMERWAEDGRERKEDMQIEIAHMDDAVGHARERIEAALLLEKIVSDPAATLDNPGALGDRELKQRNLYRL